MRTLLICGLTMVACGGSSTTSPFDLGMKVDAGGDQAVATQMVDLACPPNEDGAWAYASLLKVHDSVSGLPIANPQFVFGMAMLEAACFAENDFEPDFAGTTCEQWAIDQTLDGNVTVKAPGYADGTVHIVNDIVVDGCPEQVQVTATVTLTPEPT